MTTLRISVSSFALLLASVLGTAGLSAQNVRQQESGQQSAAPAASSQQDGGQKQTRIIQYASAEDSLYHQRIPFMAGASVGFDVCGAVMAVCTSYGQYEGSARLNLKGQFFPTIEAGWGMSNHTDASTSLHFKTGAPYFRLGCDYNIVRDRRSGNRILAGLRYGFTFFNYDLSGPDIEDPNYHTFTPFSRTSLKGRAHWIDICFGLEAKVVSFVHLGWSVRYRLRLSQKADEVGQAWYIPGYGKNGTHCLSGTFNIIFDI